VLVPDATRTITNKSVHAVLNCPKISGYPTLSWVLQSSNSAHYFWVILGVETGRTGVFGYLRGLKTSSGMVCGTMIAVTTVDRASTPRKRQAPWLHTRNGGEYCTPLNIAPANISVLKLVLPGYTMPSTAVGQFQLNSHMHWTLHNL
jgi:hypothetical protein